MNTYKDRSFYVGEAVFAQAKDIKYNSETDDLEYKIVFYDDALENFGTDLVQQIESTIDYSPVEQNYINQLYTANGKGIIDDNYFTAREQELFTTKYLEKVINKIGFDQLGQDYGYCSNDDSSICSLEDVVIIHNNNYYCFNCNNDLAFTSLWYSSDIDIAKITEEIMNIKINKVFQDTNSYELPTLWSTYSPESILYLRLNDTEGEKQEDIGREAAGDEKKLVQQILFHAQQAIQLTIQVIVSARAEEIQQKIRDYEQLPPLEVTALGVAPKQETNVDTSVIDAMDAVLTRFGVETEKQSPENEADNNKEKPTLVSSNSDVFSRSRKNRRSDLLESHRLNSQAMLEIGDLDAMLDKQYLSDKKSFLNTMKILLSTGTLFSGYLGASLVITLLTGYGMTLISSVLYPIGLLATSFTFATQINKS